MSQQAKISSHLRASLLPVSFYHRTDSLLFQFILSELIPVHHELTQMIDTVQKIRVADFRSEEFTPFLHTLALSAHKLSGSAQENMRLFCWNLEAGALTKLRNYCTLFLQNKNEADKPPILMHRYANRAWLLCLQSLDCIRVLQHNLLEPIIPAGKIPEMRESLISTTDKLFGQVQRLNRLVARVALNFSHDENVLYFLLQQHEEFGKIYGESFVNKIFEKMFSAGVPEAGQFLLQKYGARGFHDLFPAIASKITELQMVLAS
ncbi:MAG: hypothetical protein CK425_10645 [Parachlamydia sp.]|nr:MAG: hypothetical protein CK425_10645 [Parachlamydia sp.]